MSAIQNKQLFLSRIPTNGFQESLSKMTKGDLKIIHIFLHLLLQAVNLLNLQLITPPPPLLCPVHLRWCATLRSVPAFARSPNRWPVRADHGTLGALKATSHSQVKNKLSVNVNVDTQHYNGKINGASGDINHDTTRVVCWSLHCCGSDHERLRNRKKEF